MNRDQKAAAVAEIAQEIREAETVFAIDYRGLSVAQAADLRARLRGADARFRVVKNTLTERAADAADAAPLKALLTGPTALTFVRGDAALAAKALADTARTLQILEFKGGVMQGAAISAEDIRAIARLPARDVLYGQLVGVVASPLSGLARTLNTLLAGVAVALGQIREQGLVGSGGDAAAPDATTVAGTPAEQTEHDPDSEPPRPTVESPEGEPAVPGQPDQTEGEDEDTNPEEDQ